MELKDKIIHYRKKAGLTQSKLAEKVGIHKNYLSAIENGYRPSLKTLAEIASHLKIDLRELEK